MNTNTPDHVERERVRLRAAARVCAAMLIGIIGLGRFATDALAQEPNQPVVLPPSEPEPEPPPATQPDTQATRSEEVESAEASTESEPPAPAPPAIDPARLIPAVRDLALERLIDRVLSLPVDAKRTVATLVCLHPEAEIMIRRTVIARHTAVPAKLDASGRGLEVTVSLTLDEMNDVLRQVMTTHFPDVDARRVQIDPSFREGILARGRLPLDHVIDLDIPGWRHVSAARLAMVEEACRLDARYRVLDILARLRLTAHQSVRDLLQESPAFRESVERRIDAMVPDHVEQDVGGFCVLELRLERADVLRLLINAANEARLPEDLDFSRVNDARFRSTWVIRAYGVLPPGERFGADALADVAPALPPGWPREVLSASARASAPDTIAEPGARRQMAERLARFEARRRLWLAIEALPWVEGATVGEMLASRNPSPAFADLLERDFFETVDDPVPDEVHVNVQIAPGLLHARLMDALAVPRSPVETPRPEGESHEPPS